MNFGYGKKIMAHISIFTVNKTEGITQSQNNMFASIWAIGVISLR